MMAAAMQQPEIARPSAAPDARAWAAPVIDGAAVPGGRGRRVSDEQREEESRLYAEAQTRGHAAGLAGGQQEIRAKIAQLDEAGRALGATLDALSRPLAHLDDQVHDQIALLALRIARSVVRRELRTDPSQVIGMVRETVGLLPAATRAPRVLLHPEDAALVRERVAVAGSEAAWSIVEDPMLARGDCRVLTDYAQVDARVETRLQEALTALVGEDRARPRHAEEA